MLVWGIKLVGAMLNQTIPDFPAVSVGLTYLPIPVGGGDYRAIYHRTLHHSEILVEPEAETVSGLTTE